MLLHAAILFTSHELVVRLIITSTYSSGTLLQLQLAGSSHAVLTLPVQVLVNFNVQNGLRIVPGGPVA